MKVLYIVGLEHSGTTLTDHVLSSHPKTIGLGEISAFFSPSHMQQYMNRWRDYSDVTLCSCAKDWSECEFWGELIDLCGLNSTNAMIDKYKCLFSHVKDVYGDDAVVIDSSKSLETLEMLIDHYGSLDISLTDIFVVFTIKDVRSFSASIVNKSDSKRSLRSILRSFNYWNGANKNILDYLRNNKLNFSINLYEELCADPTAFVNKELARAGCAELVGGLDINKDYSHIAMGNKNFIMRNRNQIKYDSRWFYDDLINFSYLIHNKARRLNKNIYALYKAQNNK